MTIVLDKYQLKSKLVTNSEGDIYFLIILNKDKLKCKLITNINKYLLIFLLKKKRGDDYEIMRFCLTDVLVFTNRKHCIILYFSYTILKN